MLIPISDATDPRVDFFRDLKRPRPGGSKWLMVESKLSVARAIECGWKIESILTDERCVDEISTDVSSSIPVYVAPRAIMNGIVGFEFHRNQLACVERQQQPDLVQITGGNDSSIVVVCPEIADPTNLAGIIRNAAALGADGILLGPSGADPFSRRSIRVSVGNVFRIPIRRAADLEAELEQLRRENGFETVATVLASNAEILPNFRPKPRTALLLGSEGEGLGDHWIRSSDRCVTLPMKREADSLNVATASGIILYHFAEQLGR